MIVQVTPANRGVFIESLAQARMAVDGVAGALNTLAGVPPPVAISEIHDACDGLVTTFGNPPSADAALAHVLSDEQGSLLRSSLALARRAIASDVESKSRLVFDEAALAQLRALVQPYDTLLDGPFAEVVPARLPKLGHFATPLGRRRSAAPPSLSATDFDPKHQVLISSAKLDEELVILRHECDERGRPFAVVFADLDGFKEVNTAVGEVAVDTFILPAILMAVEASAYGIARAYRFGGDEFVLTIPNGSASIVGEVTQAMKTAIAAVKVTRLQTPLGVSIGAWITDPDSHLTGLELVHQASQAKQFAKDLGRGRIVCRTERSSKFDETVTV